MIGLFSLGSYFSLGDLDVLQGLLSLLQLGLLVAATVFMFRPDAGDCFLDA